MTAQMIIKAAESKGLRYEVNKLEDLSTPGSPYVIYEVGVNYRGWIWGWFTFTNSTEGWAIFREAYNQATGAQDKTARRGLAIQRQLSRGLDLWNVENK